MATLSFTNMIKTREVEDPVNLWVHRPLAYAFVRLVYKTPLSPNGVTFLSIGVGLCGSVLFIVGTPEAMLIGAILVWAAAILDGADGMLARARRQYSKYGRAIDGGADTIVIGAGAVAVLTHLYLQTGSLIWAGGAAVAAISGLYHFALYDFYKEWYLRMTRPDRSDHETIKSVRAEEAKLKRERGPWFTRFGVWALRNYLEGQDRFVRYTNPLARREDRLVPGANARSAQIYRTYNSSWMKVWAVNSPSPHADLMCLCAAIDRIDLYVIIRGVLLNALFVVAIVGQRRATARTFAALERDGLLPSESFDAASASSLQMEGAS